MIFPGTIINFQNTFSTQKCFIKITNISEVLRIDGGSMENPNFKISDMEKMNMGTIWAISYDKYLLFVAMFY